MKTGLNNTLRLTRIIKNGIAVVVAVLVVNSLEAQTATQQNGNQATPNQSGNAINNSSTSIGNNQGGNPAGTQDANSSTAVNGNSSTQPNGNQATPNQSGDAINNASTAVGNNQGGNPSAQTAAVPTTPDNNTVNNVNDNNGVVEKTSHRAKEFLKDAVQANSAEIALSEVAESKAQNDSVKQLAQHMITDHQKSLQQLEGVAQAHGIACDQSLDWINQHEVNRLRKAKEGDFDKDYTKTMLKDHVKAIKMYQEAANDVKDMDVKEYAQNTLPTLREHLQHAEEAARAAGLDDSTVNSIVKDVPTGGTN